MNAGNIFGTEDKSPVPKWEKTISKTLNRIQQSPTWKVKSYSDPPSPSRFKPSEDSVQNIEEEDMLMLDSEETECLDQQDIAIQDGVSVSESSTGRKLMKMLSSSERIGLTWPEPPLDLISPRKLEQQQINPFKTYNSFKSSASKYVTSDIAILSEVDLESLMRRRKRKPHYVKIISKQMVGIFLTIWVRRNLRRHIQNLKVSTVGVGLMGFIGNKVN